MLAGVTVLSMSVAKGRLGGMGRRNQTPKHNAGGKRVWKIAAYIRLSREDGNDVSNSVKNQKERILVYLSDFEDKYELIGIYIDDGYTGADTNRDSFQRMMRHIKEHKVNCVVVKDLSRLSRNVADAAYYLENIFVEYDIRFISLELPSLDSYLYPEQMNSILVPMQNVINDDFCRQTSLKVRSVFNTKRRSGQFIGAFAPYGYYKNPKDKHSFLIDEKAARVVRDIFKWYVMDGMSKNGIAKKLNDMGIANPSSYKKQAGLRYKNPNTTSNDAMWGAKTISDILQNQMYLGHMVQGRYRVKSYKVKKQIKTPEDQWFIVKNTHEAIIKRDLFDKAKSLRQKDTRVSPGKRVTYTLSGFVRCADCKKAMVRSQGGSKTKYSYYQCRTFRDKSKKACTKHSIRADVLEEVVFWAIKAQMALMLSPQSIIEEIENADAFDKTSRLDALLSEREKELSNTHDIKDCLYVDWKNGDIRKEDYKRLKEKYEAQAESVKSSIAALQSEKQTLAKGDSSDAYLNGFIECKTIDRLERAILVDLVDTIYVHEGGQVEIQFSFCDPHMLMASCVKSEKRQ